MDSTNFPTWVTWVFSGIGCLILTWIITLCFRKGKTPFQSKRAKSKVKGDNNAVVQGSENSNITITKNE